MADEMDQLFCDIISECNSEEQLLQFSNSVRDRLEKYERNVRKEIVSRKEDDRAPLFYACQTGKEEIVEYLISTCDADVEQRGSWDECDEIVSPLWCAAANGLTPIIDCLLRHGGQVNAISDIGKTPVQAACSDIWSGNLDVVEYLVEHGADINLATKYGETCLMEAIHNVKICEFLLKKGADVNARNRITNTTALHDAIEEDMLDTVKLLLDYGADVTLRSCYSNDALQTACLKGSRPIFDYLVERGSYSPKRLADANELMGSCFKLDNTQTTLKYWRIAIEIRNSNAVNGKSLAKTPSMPKRDCYWNASEFTTFDEFDAIALDSDALKIQKLLIHERILGEHHPATFNALEGTAASYTEPFRYQYCFDLWRRALEIGAANADLIVLRNVSNVAESLVRAMVHSHKQTFDVADRNRDNKERPRFSDVVAIFKLLTSLLGTACIRMHRHRMKQSTCYSLTELAYNRLLKCITYLIYLLVNTARTSEAEAEVRALVRHLVNQNPRSAPNDDTLLHLCVSCENTIVVPRSLRYDNEQRIFPDLEVAKLLLECEADVNARNVAGKTSFHIASCFENFSYQLVKLLLDHGAHLDTPDKSGSTPADEIYANNYMTLQCLAAQTIIKYEIQCNDLPASVNQFLDLHRL